jgi:hypothetical protein
LTETTPETGKGKLFRDSKFGNLANGAAVVVVLYLADAITGLDVTPLPDALEPLALAAISTGVGLLAGPFLSARGTSPMAGR